MTRGGEPTPLPSALPVFTTEENASEICSGEPFAVIQVDVNGFYEILKECRDIEDVILDMGTPNAVKYRVEELLARIKPDSESQN